MNDNPKSIKRGITLFLLTNLGIFMKTKFIIHAFFVSNQTDSFAVISQSEDLLLIQKEIIKKLFDSNRISYIKSISFYRYKDIKNYIDSHIDKTSVLKVEHVENIEQLKTVLEIKSNIFAPKTELELFLSENKLLDSWISGKLIGVVANDYYERSSSLGVRDKYHETTMDFNNSDTIWKLEKYFNGSFMERYGDHSYFYYRNMARLISVMGKKCNQEWLNEVKKRY